MPFPTIKPVVTQDLKRLTKQDVAAKIIDQSGIAQYVIFNGLAVNRPDGTTEVKAYFANDTGILSIWSITQQAWLDVALT